jgi:hypothetical protein
MESMLAWHADPSIPDGTLINLAAQREDDEIAMAIRDRHTLHGNGDASGGGSAAPGGT